MSRLVIAALLAAVAAPALAQSDSYTYCARISYEDHFASDGVELSTVGQVLRQDRANLYEFGMGDAEDEGDPWLNDRDNRAWLQREIDNQGLDGNSTRYIMNGTPYVCVTMAGETAYISSID